MCMNCLLTLGTYQTISNVHEAIYLLRGNGAQQNLYLSLTYILLYITYILRSEHYNKFW